MQMMRCVNRIRITSIVDGTRARVMPSETSSVEVNVDVDVERDGWRRPEARGRRGNARDDDDDDEAYVCSVRTSLERRRR